MNPHVYVELLPGLKANDYHPRQIHLACNVAHAIGARLILCEPPQNP